eukprot:scaffold91629_cov59-Attheya_sp.AAC.1
MPLLMQTQIIILHRVHHPQSQMPVLDPLVDESIVPMPLDVCWGSGNQSASNAAADSHSLD